MAYEGSCALNNWWVGRESRMREVCEGGYYKGWEMEMSRLRVKSVPVREKQGHATG